MSTKNGNGDKTTSDPGNICFICPHGAKLIDFFYFLCPLDGEIRAAKDGCEE